MQKALKGHVSLVRSIIAGAVTPVDASSDPRLPNCGVLLLAVLISSSQEKSYKLNKFCSARSQIFSKPTFLEVIIIFFCWISYFSVYCPKHSLYYLEVMALRQRLSKGEQEFLRLPYTLPNKCHN